jgi:hypothetical protein
MGPDPSRKSYPNIAIGTSIADVEVGSALVADDDAQGVWQGGDLHVA